MADYAKRQLKALDRIAKKIADAEGHLTKIEDSVDNEKHRTAQHETIKDIKSILKHAWKVDKDSVKLEERASEGRKDPAENHYVYMEDEEGVIKDLNKEFKELDEKLAALTDDEGGKIKVFCAEHHYLEKAKEILQNAGKYNPDDKN
ncbi:hypothetical protein [Limosilactobacillus reuteri]|uniref:hypothetical protein n=1 Tax=Limosilactobacillus reuteri TaxID=1598 RepID=UPI00233146CD|nr:hypothetical protein [Limosilactobacillus reuteri]